LNKRKRENETKEKKEQTKNKECFQRKINIITLKEELGKWKKVKIAFERQCQVTTVDGNDKKSVVRRKREKGLNLKFRYLIDNLYNYCHIRLSLFIIFVILLNFFLLLYSF
jgi:hypothetical protein